MYTTLAILAGFLFAYGAVSDLVERSWLSGPIVFTAVGFAFGPDGLDVLQIDIGSGDLRLLAEMTLAMVLFTDAANADLTVVRRNWRLPERLLLIGLPLTILLGIAVAWPLFPSLALIEMALLAAILAPTDAALGAPVVANPAVPAEIRESLNVESGLNDGICVPVVMILLGYAIGAQVHHDPMVHVTLVVAEEIGIGLAVGVAMAYGVWPLLRRAIRGGWVNPHWSDLPALAMAALAFAAAQAIGGSGFIACFVAGLLLGPLMAERRHDLLHGAETAGRALALMTWVVFGAFVVARMVAHTTWPSLIYAALSLTVIRMLPVYLCLMRTGLDRGAKLFIGWFGPRGLASIVFAIIVFDEKVPGNDALMVTIATTVLLSVIAHGATANVMAARFGRTRPPGVGAARS